MGFCDYYYLLIMLPLPSSYPARYNLGRFWERLVWGHSEGAERRRKFGGRAAALRCTICFFFPQTPKAEERVIFLNLFFCVCFRQ